METQTQSNGNYQKSPFKGIGAMRFKNGKMTLVGAVLDYADLYGDMDTEAHKVLAAMRRAGSGWSPAKLSLSRIKMTMRKIQSRVAAGEKLVPKEERVKVQSDYAEELKRNSRAEENRAYRAARARAYRAARAAARAAAPAPAPARAAGRGLGGLVGRLENLKTALELALGEVNDLLA